MLLTLFASNFSYLKKLATLAIGNHEAGFHIKEPSLVPKFKPPNSEGDDSEGEEQEGDELEGDKSENESEEIEEKMCSQCSMRSLGAKSKKSLSIEEHLAALDLNGTVNNQSIQGLLPYPMVSGQWIDFNHDLKVNEGFFLMRMVLHNYNKEAFGMDW